MISIVLPTCHRKDRAEQCIRQIVATAGHLPLEFCCPVDEDVETRGMLERVFAELSVPYRVIWHDTLQGWAASWNNGLRMATGDPVIFFADDTWPFPGWLDEALRVLHEELDGHGMVGFNDLYQDGRRLATHYLMSRSWIIDGNGGVLAYPHYRYNHNDTEATQRAINAGRYRWASHAIVRHDHPDCGRRQPDKLFNRGRVHVNADAAEYARRAALGFPNDFEAVISGGGDVPK